MTPKQRKLPKAESGKKTAGKRYYTYMVKCSDGSYYTGWTTDVEKRVARHNAGTGAKYTNSRRPVELAYCETYTTKHDAMSREAYIKQMTHAEKQQLAGEARQIL